MGNDDGKVAEQQIVDVRGRTGRQTEEGGRGEEAGEESEDEEEAELGCPAYQVVVEQSRPGMFCDDAERDALEVP
jgi:hypothetical protein